MGPNSLMAVYVDPLGDTDWKPWRGLPVLPGECQSKEFRDKDAGGGLGLWLDHQGIPS